MLLIFFSNFILILLIPFSHSIVYNSKIFIAVPYSSAMKSTFIVKHMKIRIIIVFYLNRCVNLQRISESEILF